MPPQQWKNEKREDWSGGWGPDWSGGKQGGNQQWNNTAPAQMIRSDNQFIILPHDAP